jgi:GUN4-like/Caspase domain
MKNNAAANNWAIVVGVNHYEHHPERKLRYAVRDAEHLGDFLCQSAQFESANVIRCLGEEARQSELNYPSCSNLIRILNRDLKPSKIGQVQHLWFFFSGHGISRNGRDFLVPSDCLEEDLERFSLPVDEVIAALRLHQKAEIVLILDACREKIGSKGNGTTMGAQTVKLAKERGVTTIFSCGYGQLSYELEALQQGAFTHALVEGLGQFTLPFQLEPFLQQRVNELHQEAQKSVTQTPKIQTDSTAKAFQSLLPDCVTASDVTFLIEQATEAELEEKFNDAKRWFRQVAEVSPLPTQRQAAFKALDRIDGKIARQKSHSSLFVTSSQESIPQPQSTLDAVPLESEKGIDYQKLRDLLKAEKWGEADKETLRIMLLITNRVSQGWLTAKSISKFPCEDLRTIDQLWVVSSEGKFGFSVQVKVWNACGQPTSSGKGWDRFCIEVGWKDGSAINQGSYAYNNYSALNKAISDSPQGELPYNHWISSLWGAWVGSGGASYLVALSEKFPESSRIQPDDQSAEDLTIVPLESEKGIDYGPLRDWLKAEKWENADRETLRVMLKVANRESDGWLDVKSLENFPCKDLRTIDQLWVTASKGQFGFSVQKRIWQDCGSPTASGKDWDSFCAKVGWRAAYSNNAYVNYRGLRRDSQFSPLGELPFYAVRRSDGSDSYMVGVGGRCFSSLAKTLENCNKQ